MINIRNKKDCCGCAACSDICACEAISMQPDQYGFLYPVIDSSKCVNCGMCVKVCPILNNKIRPRVPLISYAFMHKDKEIRRKSSTAGAFVALAEKILSLNGVVFGCAFDTDWSVKHIYVDNSIDLQKLVGSKYLQSRVEDSFKACKRFLQSGRYVLFSGTPCQIAGLRSYLRKEYDTLLCVDLICHGVPSPGIWQMYLRYRIAKKSREIGKDLYVKDVNFRDKSNGWSSYSLSLSLSLSDSQGNVYKEAPLNWRKDLYMRSFLHHLNMRPSCFHCRFKNLTSGSDITIGDYWRFSELYPKVEDDKIGINAFMVNTEKGKRFLDGIEFDGFESSYENIVKGNPTLVRSNWSHICQKKFLRELQNRDLEELVSDCLDLSPFKKIISKVRTLYMLYFRKMCK